MITQCQFTLACDAAELEGFLAIELIENSLGGPSYSVPAGEKLSLLPAEASELIDEFDRSVFLDPDTYLSQLAARCEHPGLRRFLDKLCDCRFFELQIHSAVVCAAPFVRISDVYFDYFQTDPPALYSLKFRRETPVGLIHPALEPVFGGIDKIDPADWGYAAGQLTYRPGAEGLFSNMGWMEPSDDIRADQCHQFYISTNVD